MNKSEVNEQLIDACIIGDQKRASAALAAGADVTYRNKKHGLTGFHCAARGGFQALAKRLLRLRLRHRHPRPIRVHAPI